MKDFKFYQLNEKYYEWLIENNFLNEMMTDVKRPYWGFVKIDTDSPNIMSYLIPLTNDKDDRYNDKKEYDKLIIYNIEDPYNPGKELNKTSVLKINKLIPVIDHPDFIYEIPADQLSDQEQKELNYLNNPETKKEILEKANEVYKLRREHLYQQLKYVQSPSAIKKSNESNINYSLLYAVDFLLAEKLCLDYAKTIIEEKIAETITLYKKNGWNAMQYAKEYFPNEIDWIDSLIKTSSEKQTFPDDFKRKSKKEQEEIINQFDNLKQTLLLYKDNWQYFQNYEKHYLAHFWFDNNRIKNTIWNPKTGQEIILKQKLTNKTNDVSIILDPNLYQAKFYYENSDLLLWFGNQKNSQNANQSLSEIAIILDKRSGQAIYHNQNQDNLKLKSVNEFKKFVANSISDHPNLFKNLIIKYNDPKDETTFITKQINNLKNYVKSEKLKLREIIDWKKIKNAKIRISEYEAELIAAKIRSNKQFQTSEKTNKTENLITDFLRDPNFKLEQNNDFWKKISEQNEQPEWLIKRINCLKQLTNRLSRTSNWNWEELINVYQPQDFINNKKYFGWNNFILNVEMKLNNWTDPRFISLAEAQKHNLKLDTKNYQPILIEKLILEEKEEKLDPKNLKTKKISEQLKQAEIKNQPVYNVSACANILPLNSKKTDDHLPIELNTIYKTLKQSIKIPIYENNEIKNPIYDPKGDFLVVPVLKEKELIEQSQIDKLLHQIAHSTGHPKRLNRWSDYDHHRPLKSAENAKEELVAQFSSLLMQRKLNLPLNINSRSEKNLNQIKVWKTFLKEEPKLFFQALDEADQVSAYLYQDYLNVFNQQTKNKLTKKPINEQKNCSEIKKKKNSIKI